jgi:cytochrome bd-type quinol oxidase subunit 2
MLTIVRKEEFTMLNLFFGNLFSTLTTVLVILLFVFIGISLKNRKRVKSWGRRVALLIAAGTAVSAFSAMRDLYATGEALFSMTSLQSNICSLAGGAIFLTGIVCIFLKKQKARKVCFLIVSALFTLQVAVIEASRLYLLTRGVL